MLYALLEGVKVLAEPESKAICPICSAEMIAKCGEINIWHWAHKDASTCDTWHESETKWHLAWKSIFPSSWVEIPIIKDGNKHIADVMRPDGLVIEFQHSPISPEQIRMRELFYQKIIWVFDIRDCAEYRPAGQYWTGHKYQEARFEVRRNINKNYCTFRWKHPRKHIAYTTTDCYLDIGDSLFQLKKMYINEPPYGGWGYKIKMIDFLAKFREPQLC